MLICTLQSEACLGVMSFHFHGGFLKDEDDAVIVPIDR